MMPQTTLENVKGRTLTAVIDNGNSIIMIFGDVFVYLAEKYDRYNEEGLINEPAFNPLDHGPDAIIKAGILTREEYDQLDLANRWEQAELIEKRDRAYYEELKRRFEQ